MFRSENNVGFVRHLFDAHSLESGFNYVCGISSCDRNFVTGATHEAFRDHCTCCHHNWRQKLIPTIGVEEIIDDSTGAVTDATCITHSSIDDHDMESMNFVEGSTCLEADDAEIVTSNRYRIDDADRMNLIAGNFMTLKEKFKVTQTSLNYAIQTVNNITELSANSIKNLSGRSCKNQEVL